MNIGLYNGVTAARASERRLDAIASNLANLETPGHKRTSTGTRAFAIPGADATTFELATYSQTDFSQGPLQGTANAYHMALDGPGFFAVEGPDGELLTRNGAFRVDQAGVLLTGEGFPVAWASKGDPLDPTGVEITVDGLGNVMQGRKSIGRLRVVDYDRPDQLAPLGGGFYQASRGTSEIPSAAVVRQKTLEGSNVQGIDELVAMIAIQRDFESARNVMQMIDQSYARLTTR
ncbi:MAG: flagellar hook basal-body protein [Planctomycetes bacterium]|nr:flagellar hook basal-body protein [Planctomycetota bacterium]